MTPAVRPRASSAFYGDFQALYGIDLRVEPGEASRSSAPTAPARRPCCAPSRPAAVGDATTSVRGAPIRSLPANADRGARHRARARRPAALPSLSVEENLLIGAHSAAGAVDPGADLRAVSGAGGAAAHAGDGALGRPAADGGDRPRAHGQPGAALVRRDQPGPGADHHPLDLRALAGIRAEGTSVVVVEQDIQRARRWPTAPTASRRAGSPWPAARPSYPRADQAAYFGVEAWNGSTSSCRASFSAGSMRCSRRVCR